jgi:hypothetical protein
MNHLSFVLGRVCRLYLIGLAMLDPMKPGPITTFTSRNLDWNLISLLRKANLDTKMIGRYYY